MNKEVKLYMVYDILSDTIRTGPKLWKIDRKRLADIKNHSLDLLLIYRILRDKFPIKLDNDKMYDYLMFHDLPEAITGDITKFEGVSSEESDRVKSLAINYLNDRFGNIIDFDKVINGFENQVDLEAKIAYMIDKIYSGIEFIKYEAEKPINVKNPSVNSSLINYPYVKKSIEEGKSVSEMFYIYHSKSVKITDEELEKYGISRNIADQIVSIILSFIDELYEEKENKTLFDEKKNFPKEATIYNRNEENTNN